MQSSRLLMASWLLLVAAFAALQPRPAAAQPAAFVCDGSPGVYLYEGLNFTGRCLRFTADNADLGELGFDDAASSVRIEGAWTATLYRDVNFGANASTLTASDENLIDDAVRNDQVSSLRVWPSTGPASYVCDGTPGVYLYDLAGFSGRCVRTVADIIDLSALGFDDVASSIVLVGPWTATLYLDRSFAGVATTVTASDGDLANDQIGSNRASSLRVQRDGLDPALRCDGGEGVYLYMEPAYRGRCLKLIADEPDLRLYGFDDRVVSVRTVGDWEATLFRDLAYSGVSTLVAADTPDLAFTPLGERQTTSIQVRRSPDPRDICDGGPGVYLYQDPGYRGRCLKLTADASDLRNYGFDDLASSVRTVGGYDATLFRDLSFTGAATPIEGDNLSLADDTVGDDQVTSLMVRSSEIPAGQLCAGEGVYLYQDPEFQGRCRKFIANVPDLRIYGFNDVASSVRIVGPYSAQLHADLAFRGPWTGFRNDDPNLADDTVGDNRATSVQVQRR